ncbi:hypothetical protein ABVK25_010894 [Lepraria finkii]|uniref:Uncharacterized protein n=1 Tax=Lepraria finkii TaxID=1340010 RepID=A0ABR4ATD1_9LECA
MLVLSRAIEPFQKGEIPTFIEHIKAGLTVLEEQPDSMLIFSGGATKRDRTSLSEGVSYLNLSHTLLPSPSPSVSVHHRIAAETHAVDSHQNLLFSILHFHHQLSHYPNHITLISHAFKRARFPQSPRLRYPLATR